MIQDGFFPEYRRQRGFKTPQRSTLASFMALFLTLLAAVAFAEVIVPASPPARVVDLAGSIPDAQKGRIEGLLAELERKTTSQIVVLTVPTLDGESIESFSLRVAELWRLGQKGKDNGLLLTVALQERQYRFEVGYGLETTLPDSFVGSLGREALVPAFRSGDYGGGILKAVETIAAHIAQVGAPDSGAPRASSAKNAIGMAFGVLITVGVAVALLAAIFLNVRDSWRRRRAAKSRGAQQTVESVLSRRRPRGGASSRDSDSASDSDSFSGGGGSFGGGGASGRW